MVRGWEGRVETTTVGVGGGFKIIAVFRMCFECVPGTGRFISDHPPPDIQIFLEVFRHGIENFPPHKSLDCNESRNQRWPLTNFWLG